MILTGRKEGTRGPSFRRRVVIYTRKGRLCVRSWPRKRGKPKTQDQADRQEWFKQATLLAKYADPRQQMLSRSTMRHLPVRPFDALISAMAGRLWAIETDDMGTLYSMAARRDVSKNLDILCPTPGCLIVRGPTFWQALEPGADGQRLRSNGPDAAPTWEDLPEDHASLGETFKATLSANQSIPSGTWTKIEFDVVDWDSESNYDNITNFRFTPRRPGKYQVTAQLKYGALPDGTIIISELAKNGTREARMMLKIFGLTSTGFTAVNALVDMNGTTDFLEVNGYQTSGAPADVDSPAADTYFEAVWVFP